MKKPQDIMDYSAALVVDFTKTGNVFILRETLNGPEQKHKIYELFHQMSALNGEIWGKDQRIAELNIKIAEMGKELSRLKRQKQTS